MYNNRDDPHYTEVFNCESCMWQGEVEKGLIKILLIMYKSKDDKMIIWYRVMCPRCGTMVAVRSDEYNC